MTIEYEKIKHSKYKYTLLKDVIINLQGYYPNKALIFPNSRIPGYIQITRNKIITVHKGYAWDGPSGPTIDTENFIEASLIHDALYQIIREKHLLEKYRKIADVILYHMCRELDMNWIRAQYVYWSLRVFGYKAVENKYE